MAAAVRYMIHKSKRLKQVNQQRIIKHDSYTNSMMHHADNDDPCRADTTEIRRVPQHQQHQALTLKEDGAVNNVPTAASSVGITNRKRQITMQLLISCGQSILRDNADESNSIAADAFSNSLVDSALKASTAAAPLPSRGADHRHAGHPQSSSSSSLLSPGSSGGESSSSCTNSSSGGDNNSQVILATRQQHHHNHSNNHHTNNIHRGTSGSSEEDGPAAAAAGPGDSGGDGHYPVTATTGGAGSATTTMTTSDDDDRDSSSRRGTGGGGGGAHGEEGAAATTAAGSADGTLSVGDDEDGVLSSETTFPGPGAAAATTTIAAAHRLHHQHTHHHQQQHHRRVSSHRNSNTNASLAAAAAAAATNSSELLARRTINNHEADDVSRLQLTEDNGSDRCCDEGGGLTKVIASSFAGGGGSTHVANHKRDNHNVDGFLLSLQPPHHEPGYHIIRKTFLRARGGQHNNKRSRYTTQGTTAGTETSSSSSPDEKQVSNKLWYAIKEKHGGYSATSMSSSPTMPPSWSRSTGNVSERNNLPLDTAAVAEEPLQKKFKSSRQLLSPEDNDHWEEGKDTNADGALHGGQDRGEDNSSCSGYGSGTDEGYMGSADCSKEEEENDGDEESSSSISSDDMEILMRRRNKKRRLKSRSNRGGAGGVVTAEGTLIQDDGGGGDEEFSDSSYSSEIADFSSSTGTSSENGRDGADTESAEEQEAAAAAVCFEEERGQYRASSSSPSISSEDGYKAIYFQAKNQILERQQRSLVQGATGMVRRRQYNKSFEDEQTASRVIHPSPSSCWTRSSNLVRLVQIVPPLNSKTTTTNTTTSLTQHQHQHEGPPPIMTIGWDIMAHVLTFLQPPLILDVLTMPLSKDWRQAFTFQPELWRVLCLVEPFKAHIEDDNNMKNKIGVLDQEDSDASTSMDSFCSLGKGGEANEKGAASPLLYRYRLLYTSFVRCMTYLSQIRDDALNGRAPSFIDYGMTTSPIGTTNNQQQILLGQSRNLQNFLARAQEEVANSSSSASDNHSSAEGRGGDSSSSEDPQQVVAAVASVPGTADTNGSSKKRKRRESKKHLTKEKKPNFGHSQITERLLGPSASGEPGSLDLPWSCAIYSIVNWMVSFNDVEGIQTLCLKVLPFLLENEQQRQTAQRAGLTDIVLRAMVLFPDSVKLHIAAFHTIVLLARPLGGREGMLFHSSMVLSGTFGGRPNVHPKSGIAIMVESMKRFEDSDVLQAMSCWALVNIALAPSQKSELVKFGGIKAACNAMRRRPFSAEVQFRALFALINLVIPSVRLNRDNTEHIARVNQIQEVSDISERKIIDESVSEIAGLVVQAMKNFCSSEAILNRACLVLHNLSLTQEYHSTMLWTPNCYQMLEWCLTNYRNDRVLQQSATGTLHRLQMTLSSDRDLSSKFTEQLQSQQQVTLFQAHREAVRLHERQEELNQQQIQPEAEAS